MNKREWMLHAGASWLGGPRGFNYNGLAGLIMDLSDMYDAIVAASPEPTDEGWIEHYGEKPYPEGMVDVELRSGSQYLGMDSDEWLWTHDPDAPEGDIIRWRPA